MDGFHVSIQITHVVGLRKRNIVFGIALEMFMIRCVVCPPPSPTFHPRGLDMRSNRTECKHEVRTSVPCRVSHFAVVSNQNRSNLVAARPCKSVCILFNDTRHPSVSGWSSIQTLSPPPTKQQIRGLWANKYRLMITDLREWAKSTEKFFKAVKGEKPPVRDACARLVKKLQKRMKLQQEL